MKAVSIHQPWAWAILHAGKNVENRTWRTHHRGPLLIHAARSRKSYDQQDAGMWPSLYGVELPPWEELTTGAILGVVDVVDCVEIGLDGDLGEHSASVWALEGMYGWVLANPRAFTASVPRRGAQMLFDVLDNSLPTEVR
ncbi:MAG: ASCH domain-containing protein [Planctomycetia bacterium]|nr:ASCH domain-containing protein [Planctomycetia bacterium]